MSFVYEERLLSETLQKFGIELSSQEINIIDCATPRPGDSKRLYEKVNQMIKERVNEEKHLGKCFYLTGEFGVVKDIDFVIGTAIHHLRGNKKIEIVGEPVRYMFRETCEDVEIKDVFETIKNKLRAANSTIAKISEGEWMIYDKQVKYHCIKKDKWIEVYFPLSNISHEIYTYTECAGTELLKWYHSFFFKEDCRSSKLAELFVPLYYLSFSSNVFYLKVDIPHFLCFGENHILLQQEHPHGRPKYMWLIRSESLKKSLTTKFEDLKKHGAYISGLFRRKLLDIGDIATLNFLEVLCSGKPKSEGLPKNVIEDLKAIGFLTEKEGRYEVTSIGIEFLKFVEGENVL